MKRFSDISCFAAAAFMAVATSLVAADIQPPQAAADVAPAPPIPVGIATVATLNPPPNVQTTAPRAPFSAIVVFDADLKETNVNAGTLESHFAFNLTNISSGDVTINGVATSCGCTAAKLPASPWKLAPGEGGEIGVTMNLAGRSGSTMKTVTVNSDKGTKILTVKTTILPMVQTTSTNGPVPNS